MDFKKRGTLFVPVKPVMLEFVCLIEAPMTPLNNKMYLYLALNEQAKNRVGEIHVDSKKHLNGKVSNPLVGHVLKVKVPYKYEKVACTVSGNKAVQELVKGDKVTAIVEYCGVWDVNGHCGPSWKIFSLQYQ